MNTRYVGRIKYRLGLSSILILRIEDGKTWLLLGLFGLTLTLFALLLHLLFFDLRNTLFLHLTLPNLFFLLCMIRIDLGCMRPLLLLMHLFLLHFTVSPLNRFYFLLQIYDIRLHLYYFLIGHYSSRRRSY